MKTKRQNSTKSNKKAKAATHQDTHEWSDYFCNISFKMLPANARTLENFSFQWTEAARNDKQYINIWEYPVMIRGLSRETVFNWMERDENVKKAHTYVRSLCSIRRDKGAAVRELDGSWIAKTMPIYCDDYKNLEEWRAHLSEKIAGAGGLKVVEIPGFADADLLKKDKK